MTLSDGQYIYVLRDSKSPAPLTSTKSGTAKRMNRVIRAIKDSTWQGDACMFTRKNILLNSALVTLFVLVSVTSSTAQAVYPQVDSKYPVLGSDFESPFVKVAEQLKPAVVYVEVIREREVAFPFRGWDPFREFFGQPTPEQDQEPRIQKVPGSGSGVIIDAEGYILTNNHVVEDATEITVTLEDGSEQKAEVIGRDPETDLALIKINPVPADHVAPLGDSDKLRIGEWAIAMGNPLGLDWTLTVGVISAKGRSNLNIQGGGPTFQDFIQTDASINFGNSGGPLTNIHGEVIGINAVVNANAQNIGFAIPINIAKEVVRQLRDSGQVRRGYLGMLPAELTPIMREALKLDNDLEGVFVQSVEENTPAEKGGLLASDVILEVDGQPVDNVNDFRFRVAAHAPGDKMSLLVVRDGKNKKLNFTLGDRADLVADTGRTPSAKPQGEWMGLDVLALNDSRLGRTSFEVDHGVVVVNIKSDSPAEGKLRKGDVIVEVDKHRINDVGDWNKVTSSLEDEDRAILIKYHSQGKTQTSYIALKK